MGNPTTPEGRKLHCPDFAWCSQPHQAPNVNHLRDLTTMTASNGETVGVILFRPAAGPGSETTYVRIHHGPERPPRLLDIPASLVYELGRVLGILSPRKVKELSAMLKRADEWVQTETDE